MSSRRRSSQYSLFPNCSSPSESDSTNGKSLSRHSSVSSRSSRHSRKSTDLPLRDHLTTLNNQSSNLTIQQQSKQFDEMGRLIPLKLDGSPVTKSSTNLPSPIFQSKSSSVTTLISEQPILPKAPKRIRPGPVTDLTILPYTETDWKKVMEEVKILYSKGQYKHCSARCKQILDNIKDPVSIYTNIMSMVLTIYSTKFILCTQYTFHFLLLALWR